MQLTSHQIKIAQFAALIKEGIDAWVKAGEIIVELLNQDPTVIDQICAQNAWITPEICYRFEQIGRKQVSPQLLLSDTPGVRRLRSLPFSQQERYANEPLELLVVENGKTDVLKIHVKNLTPAQTAQVFEKDSVRDIAKQRAYLFDKQSKDAFPVAGNDKPYTIVGGKVRFKANCTLTARQIAEILTEIQ